MIYTSAIYANSEHTQVTGTDANGATETRPLSEPHEFRREKEFITGFLANGGTIAPYVAPAQSLPDLAPYQFRAMLALSGKQADLEAFIEALPEPNRTIARAKLEYSLTFKRDNDLVVGARAGLALTDAEMDALWMQASAIL